MTHFIHSHQGPYDVGEDHGFNIPFGRPSASSGRWWLYGVV